MHSGRGGGEEGERGVSSAPVELVCKPTRSQQASFHIDERSRKNRGKLENVFMYLKKWCRCRSKMLIPTTFLSVFIVGFLTQLQPFELFQIKKISNDSGDLQPAI